MTEEDLNPYELLELKNGTDSTTAEIKKAYRNLALLKHPDKNPNVDVKEFLQIQQAYDILCDEDAKGALDNLLRARAAREARLSVQSAKRRRMREDLEQRERKSREENDAEMQLRARLKVELDRLRKDLKSSETQYPVTETVGAPGSHKDTSRENTECMVKLSWGQNCSLSENEISALFAALGSIKLVVMKKAKKKRKGGGALMEMGSKEEAESVVRYVRLNGGLGLDCFTASLISKDGERQGSVPQPPQPPQPSFPDVCNERHKDTEARVVNLQSMEDVILSKMKRKSLGEVAQT